MYTWNIEQAFQIHSSKCITCKKGKESVFNIFNWNIPSTSLSCTTKNDSGRWLWVKRKGRKQKSMSTDVIVNLLYVVWLNLLLTCLWCDRSQQTVVTSSSHNGPRVYFERSKQVSLSLHLSSFHKLSITSLTCWSDQMIFKRSLLLNSECIWWFFRCYDPELFLSLLHHNHCCPLNTNVRLR